MSHSLRHPYRFDPAAKTPPTPHVVGRQPAASYKPEEPARLGADSLSAYAPVSNLIAPRLRVRAEPSRRSIPSRNLNPAFLNIILRSEWYNLTGPLDRLCR